MAVQGALLSQAKLLPLHWICLVMDQGMESPCTCPPDSWDCDLGCSSPVPSLRIFLAFMAGKGFHLPGICVCSFSHEQPEEKMRSRACSGVRNKSYLKAEEMIQMGTFVLVMVFIKNHLPASLLNPTLIFKKNPSKTQIFDLIDLLLIELTGDL